MDALVGKYSRPVTEQTDPFEDECQDLMNPTDHLSMKFAMPPVSQVRPHLQSVLSRFANICTARVLAPRRNRRPL